MFGILDVIVIVLILIRRRRCSRCDRVFWAPPPHPSGELAIGRERYVCVCGNIYETGRREWAHLSVEEKHKYLWSGLVMIPIITTATGVVGGYLLRWHEPYWFMAIFIGFLGLLSGLNLFGRAVIHKVPTRRDIVVANQIQRPDFRQRNLMQRISN